MQKPAGIDPLADKILQRLSGVSEASHIVLGGYLALQHHLDYRKTHDIDAWWRGRASAAAEAAIRHAMQQVAHEEGAELRERRFGETVSFELVRGDEKHFAFQIAVRSVTLEEPVLSAWPPILIETLADTVGSKMNALVDRGAPRDFVDIKAVVDNGLIHSSECWKLWSRKNPGQDLDAAKQKVLLHLTALEMRRPLESIADPAERKQAQEARRWFREMFLKA
jgi:hypothetical protein